ncbi:type II toxin-antitoxin system RelE/ParE family toxin [Minwuia thermotolerans]|uniref:Plasmid maintenance system killer protein n=1 Tax=Minwuia thermotolerans TaxID=2056226 RepID=A0A2M9G054_9PROT|nr:type II toxin-antitoxin system RelE/ParE family toxin [Minwuia thermotolerans]PJK29054.1 plasmid maintenance system killer protein [Minwuia thermotolerans]
MIESFRHRGLRDYWRKGRAGRLDGRWLRELDRILAALEAAERPEDLNYPGAFFHALKGVDRYAVRVTGNFRVTFAWRGEAAVDVDLEDYH